MVKPKLCVFPRDGAPSPLLTTSYQNVRCLYLFEWFFWTTISMGRYLLWLVDLRVLLIWGVVDSCILCLVTFYLVFNNCFSHHRERYLHRHAQMDAKEITHCLTILHYKEPEDQLFRLVVELAQQSAAGKKVLVLGMEQGTPDKERKIEKIQAISGEAFDQILYTVHDLKEGEIPGTGSNHFTTQVAAEENFEDKTNVIFSKFDCNMRISGKLLEEIEAVWCSVDMTKRKGITFMPNVFWSADIHDKDRSMLELICSFAMSVSTNMAPFSMAFVSGSLLGAIEVGYTPPGLLSEDELMFTKKIALIPGASTYRLSSSIMKIFYPPDARSFEFGGSIYIPKLLRWFVGWIEVHAYLLSWLCRGLRNHPHVKHPLKSLGVFFLTIIRMYTAFVIPLSSIPMAVVYYIFWHVRQYQNAWDNVIFGLLVVQVCTFVFSLSLTLFSVVRIQCRMYQTFDCLQFHYKSLMAYIFGVVIIMFFPLRILWCYFYNGMMNIPVVHTAQLDHIENTYQFLYAMNTSYNIDTVELRNSFREYRHHSFELPRQGISSDLGNPILNKSFPGANTRSSQ